MAENPWTHEQLKSFLELGPIADLEKLIANPGRKYRTEYAHTCAITGLRKIPESNVLPEHIPAFVKRILDLHEPASDTFIGMNLSTVGAEDISSDQHQ